jgi:hypothetical protein
MPGDSNYGFPLVGTTTTSGDGTPIFTPSYPNPMTKDLIGFAAKGNIIIGDYTDNSATDSTNVFHKNVLPLIKPGKKSKTQAYAVDPTDVALGYDDSTECPGGVTPCFSGNYDRKDLDSATGNHVSLTRLNGSTSDRKFYESSLNDAEFKQYVNMPTGSSSLTLAGAYYTNHTLAGFIPSNGMTVINGTLVSRDDGLMMNGPLQINHDIRLLSGAAANQIVLPMAIGRPRLSRVQTCDPDSRNPC